MKYFFQFLFITILIFTGCGGSADHNDHGKADQEASDDSPNQALYNEVMDIHDEVMPKMENLYNLKRQLGEKIAAPGITAERKLELQKVISGLDSAENAMTDWMHKFNPLPDSLDQQKAREYLETEMERIKKIGALTNEMIEKATEETAKK